MQARIVFSDYNREAYRRTMDRLSPGKHPPLLIVGPSGIGKSLLLETLAKRAVSSFSTARVERLTAESWVMDLVDTLRRRQEPVSWNASLILLDNVEELAHKGFAQARLGKAVAQTAATIVMVANCDPSELGPLVSVSGSELLELQRPTKRELKTIAGALSLPGDRYKITNVAEGANPGEVRGALTRLRAERALA